MCVPEREHEIDARTRVCVSNCAKTLARTRIADSAPNRMCTQSRVRVHLTRIDYWAHTFYSGNSRARAHACAHTFQHFAVPAPPSGFVLQLLVCASARMQLFIVDTFALARARANARTQTILALLVCRAYGALASGDDVQVCMLCLQGACAGAAARQSRVCHVCRASACVL